MPCLSFEFLNVELHFHISPLIMELRNEKKIAHIDFPTYERQPVRWIRNNSYFYGSYYG